MDSLLDRVEENRLDALYLFINDYLRDRGAFNGFFQSLVNVLELNWSVQRVEVGHEFLSMVVEQKLLFTRIAEMESLRTLIFSDGYVPRKDYGTIHTQSLLTALPKARNLTILDVQRIELEKPEQVDELAEVMNVLESLEEVRITALYLAEETSLDPLVEAWIDMGNLKSLSVSTHPDCKTKTGTLMSKTVLQSLLQDSTTLQDLTLRAMHLDDAQCKTMASALTTNSFLTSLDIRQNPDVGGDGYNALLEALELNHGLWCSVMVDSRRFQGLFNLLIELNQAGRGDLLRSPSLEKLGTFIAELQEPTALWFFLRIHNTIRDPLVDYLEWKGKLIKSHQTTVTRIQPNKRAKVI